MTVISRRGEVRKAEFMTVGQACKAMFDLFQAFVKDIAFYICGLFADGTLVSGPAVPKT